MLLTQLILIYFRRISSATYWNKIMYTWNCKIYIHVKRDNYLKLFSEDMSRKKQICFNGNR